MSVAILLGGASRRMGRDKAQLRVGGVAAATRLARTCQALFAEVLLVGGDPPRDAPGRRIPDPPGPGSPLRGLVAALQAAHGRRVLVVATDLLLVTPDLLLALVAWPEADAVVPRSRDGAQPLCALYRTDAVLPLARRRLASEERSLHGLLDALSEVAFLEEDDLREVDPAGTALTNVNTPEEFERARAALDGGAVSDAGLHPSEPRGNG
ncbi:MAG: molybdenum cofactor guanylyltransferase [Deltaproteobacteria bacterium]|nr:MAG: molybdenum cofactor guanylyltransferase [Deltaproteobacteria bacterium]